MILAVLGMLSCLWLRVLINQWVYIINIASFIASLVDPLQCNVVSLIGTNWFPTHEQITALTIINICSILGPIGGSFYALIFIDTSEIRFEFAEKMMFKALLYIAATYTCIYIPCILLFRGKPKHPPWYF